MAVMGDITRRFDAEVPEQEQQARQKKGCGKAALEAGFLYFPPKMKVKRSDGRRMTISGDMIRSYVRLNGIRMELNTTEAEMMIQQFRRHVEIFPLRR